MNAAAANIFNKVNEIPFVNGVVTSAEKIWENAQTSLASVQEQTETTLSKVAQKNLLALAKRADQLSDVLVALSEKLEPSAKSTPKASRKSAEVKVAKAAPKAAVKAAPKAAAKHTSKAKPIVKAAHVAEPQVETEVVEASEEEEVVA